MRSAPTNPEHGTDLDVSRETPDFDSVADSVASRLIERLQEAGISTKRYPDHYVLKNWVSLYGPEELWKTVLVMNTGDLGRVDFTDLERFIASIEREISRIGEELKRAELGQVSSAEDGFATSS